MPGFFDWALTDPSDPSGGYLARLLGIEQPPTSPIIPGMIPNRSTAGTGGPLGLEQSWLGLGQTSPALGALGGAARGYAMGGGALGATGGAVGGLAKAALTPDVLQALGIGGSAAAGTAAASGGGTLASLLPFLFA